MVSVGVCVYVILMKVVCEINYVSVSQLVSFENGL